MALKADLVCTGVLELPGGPGPCRCLSPRGLWLSRPELGLRTSLSPGP